MANDDVLKLNAMLALPPADYWHEIDTNGGKEAASYYTQDAVFHGQFASYEGVAKIQQFYDWRVAQGPRLAVHGFSNFRARFTGEDMAEATNYLYLYAANGVKPLPTHAPITISLATTDIARSATGGSAPIAGSSICSRAIRRSPIRRSTMINKLAINRPAANRRIAERARILLPSRYAGTVGQEICPAVSTRSKAA